ncbi:hypothetical protein JFT58_22725 [Pseudomonas sp. MF6767]|uniref:hypothetical protein n=1 Tax=Pseudomonas sp. MF6767 TaxID=2797531 RepID=UPI0018E8A4A2|nr:hypothetical protein [Pseudomonas sp. MF6767]MBJ2281103.1 hypothetical protein [Pseudomonas sp. MF6767]
MTKSHEQIEQENLQELLVLKELILEGGLIEDYDIPNVAPEKEKLGYPADLIIY